MSFRGEKAMIDRAYEKAMLDYRENFERDPEDWNEVADAFGLQLCGCGSPDSSISLVVDLIRLLDPGPDFDRDWDAIFAKQREWGIDEEKHPGVFYLLYGALDHAGLLGHGSTIRLSWPTPKAWAFVQATANFPPERADP